MSLVGAPYSMAHQSYGHNTMAPGTPSPEALYSTYYSHPSPPGPEHNHQNLYPGHWGYAPPGYHHSYSPEAAAAAAAAQSFQNYNLNGGVVSMGPVPGSPHEEYIIEMVDGCGRVVKRRSSANKKERRRTMSINNAFSELRECIPNVPVDTKVRRRTVSINNAFSELRECIPNVPVDTKLSKIKTLRLATSYISYLMEVLHNEDTATVTNLDSFKADVNNTNKQNNNNNSVNNNTQQKDGAGVSPSNSNSSMGNRIFTSSSPSSSSISSSSSSSSSSITGSPEAKRGRTGWPQAVWAQELKK